MTEQGKWVRVRDVMNWLYQHPHTEPYDLLLDDKHLELLAHAVPSPLDEIREKAFQAFCVVANDYEKNETVKTPNRLAGAMYEALLRLITTK